MHKPRLNSWKEIASYLGFEVRTVQRWEEEKRLPVHRLPGGKRQAVFAYAEELDAWLAGHPLSLREEPEQSGGLQVSPSEFHLPRAAAWWAAGVVLVIGALALLFLPRFGRTSESEVVHVSFVGEKLIAWDARDREVWSREFPGLLGKNGGVWRTTTDRARLVDLDGDGRPEVLAVAHVRSGPGSIELSQSAIYSFDADGALRWRYQPQEKWRFAGQEFEGPWIIYDMLVSGGAHGSVIWLAVNHNTWWPSFVVRLDASGHEEVRFVNSGSTYALSLLDTDRGSYLLAGGVNNEPYSGALGVLDVNAPPATSPQNTAGKFHCDNCPASSPVAYFVFPRSDINIQQINSQHNGVTSVSTLGQELSVRTTEMNSGDLGIYRFSTTPELRPVGVEFSDGHWQNHATFEREGKLHHSARLCPDRLRPRPVRLWTPTSGWQDIPLSPIP